MKRQRYSTLVSSYGDDILHSPGMQMSKRFIQHGNTSVYEHSYSVACLCMLLSRALRMQVNEQALVRGALLHDYFLYDWHDRNTSRPQHATKHGLYALENAQTYFTLNAIECDMIAKHMFPLTRGLPRYKESWLLCLADKLVSLQETTSGALANARGKQHA